MCTSIPDLLAAKELNTEMSETDKSTKKLPVPLSSSCNADDYAQFPTQYFKLKVTCTEAEQCLQIKMINSEILSSPIITPVTSVSLKK